MVNKLYIQIIRQIIRQINGLKKCNDFVIMGKTTRQEIGGDSESWHADKNRTFAKTKKRLTHKRARMCNQQCDEDVAVNYSDTFKQYRATGCPAGNVNVPKFKHYVFDDAFLHSHYKYKWDESEQSQLDTVNTMISNNAHSMLPKTPTVKQPPDPYLLMCKKQIERRGKTEIFTGHRQY